MIKDKFNKVKANLKLRLMSGLGGFNEVEIEQIPKGWETFPNTNDEWCGFEMPNSENSTACIYKAKAGSVFDPHVHPVSKEHLIVMNEGGSVTVIVEDDGIHEIDYPNSIAISKDKAHAAIFNTDTVIMCVWHPQFVKGWDGVFKKEALKEEE